MKADFLSRALRRVAPIVPLLAAMMLVAAAAESTDAAGVEGPSDVSGVTAVADSSAPTAATAASGARWYTLALDAQRLIVVDLGSVRTAADGTYVQEAQIYATPLRIQGAAQPVRRLDLQMVLDCRAGTARVTHFAAVGEEGMALLDWNPSVDQNTWRTPEAGSANSVLMGAVCGGTPDPIRMHRSSDLLEIQRLYVAGPHG